MRAAIEPFFVETLSLVWERQVYRRLAGAEITPHPEEAWLQAERVARANVARCDRPVLTETGFSPPQAVGIYPVR